MAALHVAREAVADAGWTAEDLRDAALVLGTSRGNAAGWLGPYAKPAELKDPWNHAYVYRVPGDGQPFDLASLGKDGQPGGESVDADVKYQ